MLTLDKIYHAAFVLRDVARRTDLIEARTCPTTASSSTSRLRTCR